MAFKKDKGWKEYEKAVDPRRFKRALNKNLRKAAWINAKAMEEAITREIRAGDRFKKNAALTIMIKGGGKPLLDEGTLFREITSFVIDGNNIFVGILQTSEAYDLAMAVHEGVVLRVTPAMRGLFMALWIASKSQDPSDLEGRAKELWERSPGGWLPLMPQTTQIVIPGRPFIRQAVSNPKLKETVEKNWQEAVRRTILEMARSK